MTRPTAVRRAAAAWACAALACFVWAGAAWAGPPQATPSPSPAPAAGAAPPTATPGQAEAASSNDGSSNAASPNDGGTPEREGFHVQGTVVTQYHPSFPSPYRGPQSLDPGSRADETFDFTVYAGLALWRGAELWANPEVDQGFGLSDTLGVDGFVSAEAYKVGHSYPYIKVQRLFVRQTVGLGGGGEKVDADLNQLAGPRDKNRLVFTVGKISAADIFDTNRYAHDARNDFLNWSAVDTATYDYAADAWGYTYGATGEWYAGDWTARLGGFDLSGVPNNKNLDKTFHQYQVDAEVERRFSLFGQAGAVRLTGFVSRGRMARLRDAVDLARETGRPADVALVRHYHSRPGLSVNLEQQITADLGVFARAGFADPRYEGYEFTDIDRTVAVGGSLRGKRWGRADDVVGLVGVLNAAGKPVRDYLNAGGLGILAGDGRLPDPGGERIVEAYYSLALATFARLSADFQYVADPAFNRDRGPVQVFGLRLHLQK